IPEEVLTCSAFYSMEHPLVQNYHYHAHTMALLWDLIEESPLLSDDVRLRITNELRGHQDYIDADDTLCPLQGTSRHGLYDCLCVFTGSRYFSRYYPAPRWENRLGNMQRALNWWLENPTWGERDTLSWVNTSTEPVFDYFMMAGPEPFVESGMARTMMSALEILWSGRAAEESNRMQTINLMHKASYLLKDGRYAHMARAAGYDFDRFRIGQSWWPDPDLDVSPPTDRVGRISVMPIAPLLAEQAGAPFDARLGYQFLSYRTGVGPEDGYFLLDGFNYSGRHPHHVSALKTLRHGSFELLEGYGNQVIILRNGMTENHVAKTARLDATATIEGMAYVRSSVPDASHAAWVRDILWVDDAYTLVADTVTVRDGGDFEIICQWEPMPGAEFNHEEGWARRPDGSGATVSCARPVPLSLVSGQLRQALSLHAKAGDRQTLISAIFADSGGGQPDYALRWADGCAARIRGKDDALFAVGAAQIGGLEVDAMAAHLRPGRICLMEGTRVATDEVLVEATAPLSMIWDLETGEASMGCAWDTTLALCVCDDARLQLDSRPIAAASQGGATILRVTRGSHSLTGAMPAAKVSAAISHALEAADGLPGPAIARKPNATGAGEWPSVWEASLDGRVRLIEAAGGDNPVAWAAADTGCLSLVDTDGAIQLQVARPVAPNALAVVDPPVGGVAAVAGGDDDRLRALSDTGDILWESGSVVSDHFKTGDYYYAPWFTDPERKVGIFSLLVADIAGSGTPEIVLGRPSTLEYWGLEGDLLARVPIEWGDCTDLALLQGTEEPRALVGKFYTGHDALSVLGPDRAVITNGSYMGLPEGSTMMNAWMQRGIVSVHTADINGDGAQEVVVGRAGGWNEVRAFTTDGSECLWHRSFGPDRARSRFVRSVAVSEGNGSGSPAVAVGLANGWACCFAGDGSPLWSLKFDSPIVKLCMVRDHTAIAQEDGRISLVDAGGEVVRSRDLDSPPSSLASTEQRWPGDPLILAGAAEGQLLAFRV
ncbi:MAG: hypothetical protein QGI83_10935, partial [Candidatus Latescibacteria bacterium]|nr:hypothetical protein [Candidatus Latescibacterota bacterium]